MAKSVWNEENRFTGWTDVDLSQQGREEALEAGSTLKIARLFFRLGLYVSSENELIRTLWIVLDELDLMWIPVEKIRGD